MTEPTPLSEEERREGLELLEAATEGPWKQLASAPYIKVDGRDFDIGAAHQPADAALVVWMRNHIDRLLAAAEPPPTPPERPDSWPDGFEMIRQLRRAVGLFDGALPVSPKEAWEGAVSLARTYAVVADRHLVAVSEDGQVVTRAVPEDTAALAAPPTPDDWVRCPHNDEHSTTHDLCDICQLPRYPPPPEQWPPTPVLGERPEAAEVLRPYLRHHVDCPDAAVPLRPHAHGWPESCACRLLDRLADLRSTPSADPVRKLATELAHPGSGTPYVSAAVRRLLRDALTTPPPTPERPEDLARRFHEAYTRLAPDFGWNARESVPWDEVADGNKALMVATAAEILAAPPTPDDWVRCPHNDEHSTTHDLCDICQLPRYPPPPEQWPPTPPDMDDEGPNLTEGWSYEQCERDLRDWAAHETQHRRLARRVLFVLDNQRPATPPPTLGEPEAEGLEEIRPGDRCVCKSHPHWSGCTSGQGCPCITEKWYRPAPPTPEDPPEEKPE